MAHYSTKLPDDIPIHLVFSVELTTVLKNTFTIQMPDKKHIRNSTAEFLIFSDQSGCDGLEVRYEDETIWLSQKRMARLFDVTVPTINEHLGNIYESGEIERGATFRKFRTVQTEGSREVTREVDHYNLDAIISVGYRVNSVRATQFRQWATGILRDFAIKGYGLDRKRMENDSSAIDFKVWNFAQGNENSVGGCGDYLEQITQTAVTP